LIPARDEGLADDMTTEPMRVLVAIDGSVSAAIAVDLVAHVAWPSGTKLLVVEAVETGPGLFGGPWPALAMVQADSLEAELRAEAERTVREAGGRLGRPGLTVVSAVLRGRPATAIVERARRVAADLIVVGSRGHGTIESMLLGSVSAEVIDRAPSPVMVARGSGVDRVVLGWDGSSSAAGAADLLWRWPIFAASSIRVVSVADVQIPWWTGFPEPDSSQLIPVYLDAADASREQSEQLAGGMTARLRAEGLEAEPDRREGDAAAGILAAAHGWKANVIILGTHGRTGLGRLVLGSVARNVVHHAPCSVLVVRQRPSDQAAMASTAT
jgi:nucleotide-binding universal stress UspA family protein